MLYNLRVRIGGESLFDKIILTGKTSNNKLCYLLSRIDVFFSFKESVQTKSKHGSINIKYYYLEI